MQTGMLWYDNDPKTDLPTKIIRAASYYQRKYGQRPDLCFVHPSLFKDNTAKANDIEVKPNQLILPNHLWLGFHESGSASG